MPIEPVFEIDLEDVFNGFNEMIRRGRDLRPAWRELKPVLKADLRMHARGPNGPWAPRAKRGGIGDAHKRSAKRKRKRRRRGRPLGKLKAAFKFTFDQKQLRGINAVSWSGAHQSGATVGHGAKLPKREFAYASDEFIEIMVKRILEHVTARWGR